MTSPVTVEIPHEGKVLKFSTLGFPGGFLSLKYKDNPSITTNELEISRENHRGDYMSIQPAIKEIGLRPPTISEIVSLVHEVLMNPERPEYNISEYCEENKSKWKFHHLLFGGWIYGFTGNLIVQKEGVYIQDHPSLEGSKMIMDRDKLREILVKEENGVIYSEDKKVRFAPLDNIPRGRIRNFSNKDAHLVGLVGHEQIKKLNELTIKYGLEGFLRGVRSVRKITAGTSSIQAYGLGSVHPLGEIAQGKPGGYLYAKGCLDLSFLGSVDSRPFLGAGSSYGIKE